MKQVESDSGDFYKMNEAIPDANNENNPRAIYVFEPELGVLDSSWNQ